MSLPVTIGRNTNGDEMVLDLSQVHSLVFTGPPGAGKSVALHSAICELIKTRRCDEVKFIMVDLKETEFGCYGVLPHLLVPVVTEASKIGICLEWLAAEVEKRLKLLRRVKVKSVKQYNDNRRSLHDAGDADPLSLPEIVLVIDDVTLCWMEIDKKLDAFWSAIRKGQAAGVHFLLAAQSGRFFKKCPECIRCHLEIENEGHIFGRYVFETIDVQGAMLSQAGIDEIIEGCQAELPEPEPVKPVRPTGEDIFADPEKDPVSPLFEISSEALKADVKEALKIIKDTGRASTSHFQRKLGWGYNHSARILNELIEIGAVAGRDGMGPRRILWDNVQIEQYLQGLEDRAEHPITETAKSTEELVREARKSKGFFARLLNSIMG